MTNTIRAFRQGCRIWDCRTSKSVKGRVPVLRIGIVLLLFGGACVRPRPLPHPVAVDAVIGALEAIRSDQGGVEESVAFLVDSASFDLIAAAENVEFASLVESLGSRAWIGLPTLEAACAQSGKSECRRISVLNWERNRKDVQARVRESPFPQGWCAGSFSEASYRVRETATGDWKIVQESDRDFSDCGIPGQQHIDGTASLVKSMVNEIGRHISGPSGDVAFVVDSASLTLIAIAEHLPPQTLVQALEGSDWLGLPNAETACGRLADTSCSILSVIHWDRQASDAHVQVGVRSMEAGQCVESMQATYRFRHLPAGWRIVSDKIVAVPCPGGQN